MANVDPAHLTFVDETGITLGLTRRYGRATRGQRVVGIMPRNHGRNVTVIAAMDQVGPLGETTLGKMTLTGALGGLAFEDSVTGILWGSRMPVTW